MNRHVWRTELPYPPEVVYGWHSRRGAFGRLTAPWQPVRLVEEGEGLDVGRRTVFDVGPWPFRLRWVAVHTAHERDRGFTDVMERGPMRSWTHQHRFVPTQAGCALEDEVAWSAWGLPMRGMLDRMFAWRHARTRADLDRHAPWADRPRLHVAITGGTGLVGGALADFLRTGGHRVSIVSRRPGPDAIVWDPRAGELDPAQLRGVDAVVHLAGESIGGRWTPAKRAKIRDSRVSGTSLVARTLAGMDDGPRVLVSASAVGLYGDGGDAELDEASSPGTGLLADVGREWEAAADPARDAGIRVVHPRIGIVLSHRGGALAAQLPAYRLGLGGPVGSGRQFVPWILLDDLVGALHFALWHDDLRGPFNAVAPNPVRQRDLARTLGHVLRRPAVLPAPAPAIRLVLGQFGEEALLFGQNARPRALERAGFTFRHPHLEPALREELGRD